MSATTKFESTFACCRRPKIDSLKGIVPIQN